MARRLQKTIGKIYLLLLLALWLGCSSTLFAAQSKLKELICHEITVPNRHPNSILRYNLRPSRDEKKEDTGDNGPPAHQNDPNKEQDKPLIVSVWSCPKCTFANKSTSKCCVICHTKKPLLDNKHAIWTCSACTFEENSIDNRKCTMCDNPHPLLSQHIAPKQDNNKLVEYSPIDVKLMDYEVKKDDNAPVVFYRFKFIYNQSACDISCTESSLYAIHKYIVRRGNIDDKSLVFPLEYILVNNVKRGNRLQLYLLSLFKHDKTDDEEILLKLGVWICDICKVLNELNKKCLECESEQITINVSDSDDRYYRQLEPFSISVPYANDISLAYVLGKAIEYVNNKEKEHYYISGINRNSFIEENVYNHIKSANNDEWKTLVKQKITTWDRDKIVERGLKIDVGNSYHHAPAAAKISCAYISNKYQSKYSGLNLALQCPIYRDAQIHGKFSKDILDHLHLANHFLDEYNEKAVCRDGAACKSFIRLAHNGHLVKDLCHIKLYQHPPRSNRQILLSKNVNQFICNQKENDNQPLCKPSCSVREDLFRLLDEVIKHGYQYDLCILCSKGDKCTHDVYQKSDKNNLIARIEDKFNHPRYKQMGKPFHKRCENAPDVLMLSLLLYTGGDCSYDMCKSQRNGDYYKWKMFDYCLWWAIFKLAEKEYGSYKLYSGLKKTKLSKTIIRLGYFPTYTSTTLYKDIAKKFIEENGMMIEIDESVRNEFICCDVSWISKFPDEHEIVVARTKKRHYGIDTIGDAFSMKILDDKHGVQTVFLTTKHDDIIPKIASMLQAEKPRYEITSLDVSIFAKLISNAKGVPADVREQWEELRHQQQKITIYMEYMYTDYAAFIPLLFDTKCKNILLLDKIVQLFPNVTEIICKYADYDGGKIDKYVDKGAYPSDIVNSKFMLDIKAGLSKVGKQAKLTKIVIQTEERFIADSCKLYAPQFAALGWKIGKGGYTIALTKRPYDDCMSKVSSIIQNKYPSYEATSLDVPIFNQLILRAKDIPVDVQQRWEKLRHQQQRITIDMYYMYQYDKAFMPLLTDINFKNLLLFDRIAKLFPNVTEIVCINTDYIKYNNHSDNKYSSAIVGSNFILCVKNRLSKMDKQAKLTKIVIQTYVHEIKDDCKLYAPQFAALGWQIEKGSYYNDWDTKRRNNQITLTRLRGPNTSFNDGPAVLSATNEQKLNDDQSDDDEVFDID